MTIWVAEQYGEQDTKGTLASGKLADLVILDKDPTRVDPLELKNIRVLETIKEGVTIYPATRPRPELLLLQKPASRPTAGVLISAIWRK